MRKNIFNYGLYVMKDRKDVLHVNYVIFTYFFLITL